MSRDEQPGVVTSEPAGTGTVSRALQLLGLLADAGEPVTVKTVAASMGVAPSTAHRLLNLLRQEGFVEVPGPGRYGIGAKFYRVAARVVDTVPIQRLAEPLLAEVATQFQETVLLSWYVPAENAMAFIARADGGQRLQYSIEMNKPMSLLWGASGKAILAYLPDAQVEAIHAAGLSSPADGASLPSLDALRAELAEVRRRGVAVTAGEKLPDARGVAAPAFNAQGVVGCLCLTSPRARMPEAGIEAVENAVRSRAQALSSLLGHSGVAP